MFQEAPPSDFCLYLAAPLCKGNGKHSFLTGQTAQNLEGENHIGFCGRDA